MTAQPRLEDGPRRTVVDRLGIAVGGALIRALARSGSVLCFHGLRAHDDPVASVANITIGAYRRLIELVRASAEIIPLVELHRRWAEGRSTRGLVAITFDDAYLSLLELADQWYTPDPYPITVFVVTGASETGAAFWWDRLEVLESAISVIERTRLEVACGMPGELRGQVDPIHGPLRGLRQWILGRHLGRAPSAFADELTLLEDAHQRRTTQRPMQVEELRQVGRLGPVSFGVHTVTHPVLPLLEVENAEREIRGAWDDLQEWALISTIPFLAAPFGLFSPALLRLSASCGMQGCLGLNERSLSRGTARSGSEVVPRRAMVAGTTRSRLAYRLSGLRDIVERGSGLKPPPLPGESDEG